MNLDVVTHDNFLFYCAQHYDNKNCHDVQEFYEDLNRIKYLKKLFTRYETTGDLKERLILNHIIILNNMFGPDHVAKILFLKIIDKHRTFLKPFLVLLNILPDVVRGVGAADSVIYTDDIGLDVKIVEALRKI